MLVKRYAIREKYFKSKISGHSGWTTCQTIGWYLFGIIPLVIKQTSPWTYP